jgi:hypothetical protein
MTIEDDDENVSSEPDKPRQRWNAYALTVVILILAARHAVHSAAARRLNRRVLRRSRGVLGGDLRRDVRRHGEPGSSRPEERLTQLFGSAVSSARREALAQRTEWVLLDPSPDDALLERLTGGTTRGEESLDRRKRVGGGRGSGACVGEFEFHDPDIGRISESLRAVGWASRLGELPRH